MHKKAKRVRSQARRDLALPHEADRHAMIISSGLVALYLDCASSQRRLVALRYPGEVVQPHELGLRLHALLETDVLLTETDAFWDLVGRDLELSQLASQASERAQLVAYEWLMRDAMDAASATAHFLCEHAVRSTGEFAKLLRLELTQLQIGDITAQTTVNVNRVMRGFQKDELFVPVGDRQFRANWPELRRLGRFDPGYLARETVADGTLQP